MSHGHKEMHARLRLNSNTSRHLLPKVDSRYMDRSNFQTLCYPNTSAPPQTTSLNKNGRRLTPQRLSPLRNTRRLILLNLRQSRFFLRLPFESFHMLPRIAHGLSSRDEGAISVSLCGLGEDDLFPGKGDGWVFSVAVQDAAARRFHVC